jgi:hypothetical protein
MLRSGFPSHTFLPGLAINYLSINILRATSDADPDADFVVVHLLLNSPATPGYGSRTEGPQHAH